VGIKNNFTKKDLAPESSMILFKLIKNHENVLPVVALIVLAVLKFKPVSNIIVAYRNYF